MHGDAGPDLLQLIANIGSGARKRGEFPQHARLQTVDDPGPPQPRPHNISGRLKRKAAAEADGSRPIIGIFARRVGPGRGATGICAWLSA
jgi:hypothetical protein